MKWNINSYLANKDEGLISVLELTAAQKTYLKSLKDDSRVRTRDVFKEAKNIIRSYSSSLNVSSLRGVIKQGELRFLNDDEQSRILDLIIAMSDVQRKAFLSTSPRFWVQGSFTYNTLNQPYSKPPQQMDIDDGTYMPMDMFEDQPRLGHELLMLLVDASVKSLANELGGIADTSKATCSRLILEDQDVHLDVPMYAIPLAEFEKREAALRKGFATLDSASNRELFESAATDMDLDPDSVYLAIRGAEMWKKSDPKSVADWFKSSVKRHGEILREISRFLKAWRDVQWDSKGPSSICLMKCAVDTFDSTIMPSTSNRGDFLWAVVNNLPKQLQNGVESPDALDQESGHKLFPQKSMNQYEREDVINKAGEFQRILSAALEASSAKDSFSLLERLFGKRVTNESLIKPVVVSQAYIKEPEISDKKELQSDMRSG